MVVVAVAVAVVVLVGEVSLPLGEASPGGVSTSVIVI